jgi:hypothetical protein
MSPLPLFLSYTIPLVGENGTDRQPPPEAEKPAAPAPAVPTKKPQSTFGAFSSSASPFASTSSASPFASTSKPLSTGSAFGNYSSTSSPFARKPPAFASTDAAAAPVDKEEKKEVDESITEKKEKSGNSFGDILKESKADEGDDNEKVQMTEKDGMSPLLPHPFDFILKHPFFASFSMRIRERR